MTVLLDSGDLHAMPCLLHLDRLATTDRRHFPAIAADVPLQLLP